MPGALSTAARVASQIHRDGPQTTDLLRFVAHSMGSTAVLCYLHTPIGPRAVLYKPTHVNITCMVARKLFLWVGHCILLVPPGPGASTPWVEARQHADRLLQSMRVGHAWCLSFGVSFAATSTTASGVADLGRWLSFDDSSHSTSQTLTIAEDRMVQSATAGAPQVPREHELVGRAFKDALMAGGRTDPHGSGTQNWEYPPLWNALGGEPDKDYAEGEHKGNWIPNGPEMAIVQELQQKQEWNNRVASPLETRIQAIADADKSAGQGRFA